MGNITQIIKDTLLGLKKPSELFEINSINKIKILPLETINKADFLMYEAKEQGRDKVILEDGTII